jgi:TsgA-like MFS transporter
MSDRHRTTLISFLAYFIMSGMLAPIGVISGPMAEFFDLPVTEVTARFSWLTMGIFVGAVLALFVFQWFRIKHLFLLLYTLIALSLLGLPVVGGLTYVELSLGLVGICCGIGLPAAALVISRSYAAEHRASMLVITDGFFSVAGIICAWVAVWFVARSMHWAWTYVLVAAVAVCVLVLAYTSQFPEQENFEGGDAAPSTWPASAWLCIAALCTYTLAQNTILWWLPQYAQNVLGAAQEPAGQLVSQFWSGMFAAQLFVAWWVFKIGVQRLLWLGCVCTCLFSVPLWLLRDIDALLVLATLWGFANLGLLKVVLSYATQFTPVASGRLVSGLLLGATTGTAIAPWVSSYIVAAGDVTWALRFGSAGYLVMIGLVAAAVLASRGAPATS